MIYLNWLTTHNDAYLEILDQKLTEIVTYFLNETEIIFLTFECMTQD